MKVGKRFRFAQQQNGRGDGDAGAGDSGGEQKDGGEAEMLKNLQSDK